MAYFLRYKRLFNSDDLFALIVKSCAAILGIFFIVLIIQLILASSFSIKHFGWAFLVNSRWSPPADQFGAAPIIIGTLITAFFSMFIAIPISVGVAIMITQVLRGSLLAPIISRFIELLAAIPSIIYGMWGLFVLAPFLSLHIQPWIINHTRSTIILKKLFGALPIGIGVFTASLILAIMVTPLIASMMRDIFAEMPLTLIESAYALGATRWEVVRHVLIPYVRAGLLGSIVLGFGRALGETMAVTLVIGNSHRLFEGLFMPGTTISATLANEFTEATGKLYPAALIELGLILFLITLIILLLSRYFLHRARPRGGSQ